MEIIVEHAQARVPVTIFRLSDRINLGNADELEKKARHVFDAGAHYLLIDLTNVPSMTSAGLRTIQVIYKLFEHKDDAGGKAVGKSAHLKLLNPNNDLRRVLELVGFEAYIDIYDTEKEALSAF
jgi:anti-anti-sigma factor